MPVGSRRGTFIIDVIFRVVVGWQISDSLRSNLAIGSLEMTVWIRTRQGLDNAMAENGYAQRERDAENLGARRHPLGPKSSGVASLLG
jgi:transposase InsO family protein